MDSAAFCFILLLLLIFQIVVSVAEDESCGLHRSKPIHTFMMNQCIAEHRDGTTCLKVNNYGVYNITCKDVLNVRMQKDYSLSQLVSALGDTDTPTYKDPPMLLRITITGTDAQSFNETNLEYGIDQFLIYRPWWKLIHDGGSHGTVGSNEYIVAFERYPTAWRPFLQFLVNTQYLSPEECAKSPMIFGRKSAFHPGLMPVANIFSTNKKNYPYSVFVTHWPLQTAFASASDCEGIVNKWACAFLPMTFCDYPKFILDCGGEECLGEETRGLMWSIAADSSNERVRVASAEDDPAKCGKFPLDHLKNKVSHNDREPPHFTFALPADRTIWRLDNPDTYWGVFMYLFMLRPNAMFRPKIKKLIHEMRVRSTPHFHPSTPCVAVHIRRGDRIRVGLDMMEYCQNVSYDKDPAHTEKKGCVNIMNPTRFGACPLEVNEDLGCKYVPFEAIRLKHVISKVPRLVDAPIRDLLVFSDDPIFIQEQQDEIAKTHPEWRVHTLRAPNLPADVDLHKFHHDFAVYEKALEHVRARAGTDSGILFQASLHAAQQCSAFIGHFGSGVSSLFYHAMCVEHSGRYGICPPGYDFRWGL